MTKIPALSAENAALHAEIARLKGLRGHPLIKPSGMEQAKEPKPPGGEGKRRAAEPGGSGWAIENRLAAVEVPAGSGFKGYVSYLIQDLVL